MKKLLLSSILGFGLIANTGCYKDSDNTPAPQLIVEKPDIKIHTAVHGVVTDLGGANAENYQVDINGQTFPIDQEVYFVSLEGANKRNQHISIKENGNEIAFANVPLIENDNNKVDLLRFPEWSFGNITNTQALSLNNNLQIELINSLETVELSYGSITDHNLLQQIGIWGVGANNEDYFLDNQSAFFIGAESSTVNLNLNYSVTDLSLGQNAALFHLNEDFHQWIIVDQLDQNNGNIELPEFGYYLLANIAEATFIEGSLNYDQLPISFQSMDLSLMTDQSLSLQASANGRWSSYLPLDVLGQLSISNLCGDIILEKELEINENVQSFLIELTAEDSEDIVPLSFKDLKCDETFLSTPGSIINYGTDEVLMVFPNESVQLAVLSCGNISIRGYDVIENVEGISIPWKKNIDDELEYLNVCEDFAEGFTYLKINGEMEVLDAFTLEKQNNKSIFRSQNNNIRVLIEGTATGKYAENQVNFYINEIGFGENGYFMNCETAENGCEVKDCYVSHYEEMGNGMTRVTFSGVLWMQTIVNPIAGNYQVEGQIITTL